MWVWRFEDIPTVFLIATQLQDAIVLMNLYKLVFLVALINRSFSNIMQSMKDIAMNISRCVFSICAVSINKLLRIFGFESSKNGLFNVGQAVHLKSMRVVVSKHLADGGFGSLYQVIDSNNTNRQYALKLLNCPTRDQVADAHNELKALQKCANHMNIIDLVDSNQVQPHNNSNNNTQILMLFPLYQSGTVWDIVYNTRENSPWPFGEQKAFQIVLGVVNGLMFMHGHGLSHCDIKPHNIMLSDKGSPVLIDLGSVWPCRRDIATRRDALMFEDDASTKCSAPYRAPELTTVTHPCVIDERIDIWSLGCTMYCIAFGYCPFETPKEGYSKLAVLNARYTFPPDRRKNDCVFSTDYTNTIRSMLQLEARSRPDAQDLERSIRNILVV